MSKKSDASGGIGFCSALILLFIGLKLAGVIGWSWWWVFAPWWVPVAALCAVALLLAVYASVGKCGK